MAEISDERLAKILDKAEKQSAIDSVTIGRVSTLWIESEDLRQIVLELQARRAADAGMREALRKHVIHVDPMSWHGELMMCELCEGRWTRAGHKKGVGDEPEKHAPKCFAALGARND